jgi:2-C-methyl-D-erythritol 2,4-cyclodiphosphate synthase
MSDNSRVGIGFDVHSLSSGRPLVLGGVEIPFDRGLAGWSDADVLTHAVIDALLGAAALGDIGTHFPPGEPEYKDISSLVLLEKTGRKLAENGWRVGNVDATIVTESPRLADFIDPMRRRLGKALDIDFDRISVKATTSDKLGFTGRGEGIAAHAVAMIEEK